MLRGKSIQMMHSIIKEIKSKMDNIMTKIKPNDAYFYQGNHTKGCIMVSRKSNEAIDNVINEVKRSDA